MSAKKLVERDPKLGPGITPAQAREERRCECTRGIVCMGSAAEGRACGRCSGAWECLFCTACQFDGCRQPATPRIAS